MNSSRLAKKRPGRTTPGFLLLVAGVLWVLVLARLSYNWHVHYRHTLLALSTLAETDVVHSAGTRTHLLSLAASLLNRPVPPGSVVHAGESLTVTAMQVLHHLAASQWLVSPAIWAIGFAVMGVAVYGINEGRLAALDAERQLLKEKMLAVAQGWALVATNPDGRQVMNRILTEAMAHTAVSGAAIYRLTGVGGDAIELYASTGYLQLSASPVPALFLEAERGLIGESLSRNLPLYSGDGGEAGYLIPGIRLPRVAVFPARYRDQNWGFLLLSSEQSGWFYAYRDVLELLAQQVALAAAAADVAAKARQQQRLADRARMQSDILANVSHELRTPLGLVRGYLETLIESQDKLDPGTQQEFLAVSLEETRELESLIDKLLTMSRLEDGMNLHQPDWFSPDDWIRRSLARHTPTAQQRVRIINRTRADLLFGDQRNLTTLLSDLVDNAVKYSTGPIDVILDRHAEAWSLTVRDFGPGVAEAEAAHIFERFFRGAAHAKSQVRGSGLGLSIAKHIVDMHGGHIRAENAAGGGLSVSVELPLGRPGQARPSLKGVDIRGRWRVGAGR